jgi:hypothetical protein
VAVREFLELCPNAEYMNVTGAAHMVAGDRNDLFARRGHRRSTTPTTPRAASAPTDPTGPCYGRPLADCYAS